MKHYLQLFLLCSLFLLNGCINKESKITNLSMLEGGKTFSVPTGTAADQFVLDRFPDAKILYFNSVLDCALAVKNKKADAAVYDKPILQNIAGKNEGLLVLDELIIDDQYGFAVQLNQQKLKKAIDETLAQLKANETYNDMMKRWFPVKGNPETMPNIELNGKNGVLRFGTAAVTEPMSFVDGQQKVVGFDVELATYVARTLGMQIEVVDMEFGAMLPALIAGKVDMIGAGLSITEERAKKVLFSESYYPSGIAVIVRYETTNINETANPELTTLSMLEGGKTFSVPTGTAADQFVLDRFPDAKLLYFNSVLDCALAVKGGKADAAVYDKPILQNIAGKNEGLLVLDELIIDDQYGFAVQLNQQKLKKTIDETLAQLKADGTYNDMMKRWFPIKGNPEAMPTIELNGKNGVLRFGTAAVTEPMSFVDGQQKVVGFDVELATYVARTLGMQIEVVDMEFGAMLPALIAGKVDMIGAGLSITEERAKKVLFSESYYPSGIAVAVRSSSKQRNSNTSPRLNELSDISDKRIGVYNGSIHDAFVAKTYPEASISRFTSSADMILALKSGKIDATFLDIVETKVAKKYNPGIRILSQDVYNTPLGVGFNKKSKKLRAEFNEFLRKIKSDDTYDSIHQRWFDEDAEKAVMPPFNNPISDKTLNIGVTINALPYVSFANNDYVGFDVELIRRFAEHEKYHLEMVNLEFASLIAAISTGKVDMISAGISVTEERAKQIDFSDSYADFITAVIVLDPLSDKQKEIIAKGGEKTFLKKMSESFYSNIIYEKRYLLIVHGLKVTLIISLFAALFGTLIGGLICFMRMSKRKVLSLIARLCISFIRGTPVLVLLMIIFYVVFASVNINPVFVAILAFGLNFGAYVSEMFRTSIESIDNGQKEAGIASGFTKIQTFIHIIMPQALRQVIPVYKGEFISLVKMTSIVGYIAVQDLTKASDIIRSRTFDAFFPLIMVAVIYLLISWLLTWGLSYVEISVDPKRKRLKKEEEISL